jgi:hypothetical protein
MACLLAKLDRPDVDPRKPYTDIERGLLSGRSYDEQHITRFVQSHRLPCNPTTAFLTPVLRNIGRPLTTDVVLLGKPRELYTDTLHLLNEVAEGESAEAVLSTRSASSSRCETHASPGWPNCSPNCVPGRVSCPYRPRPWSR